MPDDFMRELSMYVVRYVFSPGEVIIYRDEPVHEMYVVHRGICQVRLRACLYTISLIIEKLSYRCQKDFSVMKRTKQSF